MMYSYQAHTFSMPLNFPGRQLCLRKELLSAVAMLQTSTQVLKLVFFSLRDLSTNEYDR
jgi:hypothetical protein